MSFMGDDDEFVDAYMTLEPAEGNVPDSFYKLLSKLKKG